MITFKSFLVELFDKPYSYEHDPYVEGQVRHHYNTHPEYKDKGYGAIKVHRLEGDNGYLAHVVHKGIHELHHVSIDGDSGNVEPKKDKPNPRFISTFMHYGKEHILNKGKKLRIFATHDMHKHLSPIVKRICKKEGYESHEEETDHGKSITIHPKIDRAPTIHGLDETLRNFK